MIDGRSVQPDAGLRIVQPIKGRKDPSGVEVMSAPPYMKLFWGDYHKATRHLTRDQHGAYFLLIGEAWRLGGALPDDDRMLAAWALCTADEWADMKPIIMDFFALRRGKWVHDRVRDELASYEATSRKRKEAGKRGGSSVKSSKDATTEKTNENSKAIASGLGEQRGSPLVKPEPEPEPDSQNTTPQPPRGGVSDDEFDAIWSAYPESGRETCPALQARDEIDAAVAEGHEVAVLVAGAKRVAAHVAAGGRPKRIDRWARDRLFLNSAPDKSQGQASSEPWPGPADLWADVKAAKGEAWASSYLRRCAWSEGALVTESRTVKRTVEAEIGQILKAHKARIELEGAIA